MVEKYIHLLKNGTLQEQCWGANAIPCYNMLEIWGNIFFFITYKLLSLVTLHVGKL